jgi:hypothetical protein
MRTVFEAEALAWMAATAAPPRAAVVTSLPDVIEVPLAFDDWQKWFVGTAQAVMNWLPMDAVSIFYQSDIRHEGHWVDKGYLVMRAAELAGANVLWHVIVCRKPAGTLTQGRASYSHMIAVSRSPRPPKRPRADVLPDAGEMTWTRAMGATAARAACLYLKEDTDTDVVFDPFCGQGTVLAAANELGMQAIGVDLSAKRCKKARTLTLA